MITRDDARKKFNPLHINVKQQVANLMMGIRQEYLQSKTEVEFAQFFIACLPSVFHKVSEKEKDELRAITDSHIFVDQAICYLIDHLNKGRK